MKKVVNLQTLSQMVGGPFTGDDTSHTSLKLWLVLFYYYAYLIITGLSVPQILSSLKTKELEHMLSAKHEILTHIARSSNLQHKLLVWHEICPSHYLASLHLHVKIEMHIN